MLIQLENLQQQWTQTSMRQIYNLSNSKDILIIFYK